METTLKKERPYMGHHIREFLGETKDTISKERITTTSNRKKILELFGDTVYDTKTHLNPPTDITIKEKLSHITKELENALTNDIKAIDDLFNHFTNERNNDYILLNKQQSIIRNHIKNHPIIHKKMTSVGSIGIREFFNDIITTNWSTIGTPDEYGNRIAKDVRNWLYYINSKNDTLIGQSRVFDQHKHVIGRHSGSVGGTPRSIYGIKGEELINRIVSYKEMSEYEYYVSVGPRTRDKENKPSVTPSKITYKTDDDKIITFYIDISLRSSGNGKFHEIDKSKYKEWNPET